MHCPEGQCASAQRCAEPTRQGGNTRDEALVSRWTSDAVASALGVSASEGLRFSGVTTDTRQLESGTLFVALKGDRFDAHDFLAQAKAKGAAAAVVRRGTPRVDGLPFFEVADTLGALGLLARARRRALPPASPVVAITGSSGKTSTKEMIRAVLAVRYRVHATSGNLNNLVGVPLTILGAPDDTEALVVEAGASVPGEIARLRDVIEPTIAVITNVGYAHVEGFGSLEGVMREKLALVEGAAVAVVGTDPPELAREVRRRTRTVVAGNARAGPPPPPPPPPGAGGRSRWWWARCWSWGPRVTDCMRPSRARLRGSSRQWWPRSVRSCRRLSRGAGRWAPGCSRRRMWKRWARDSRPL